MTNVQIFPIMTKTEQIVVSTGAMLPLCASTNLLQNQLATLYVRTNLCSLLRTLLNRDSEEERCNHDSFGNISDDDYSARDGRVMYKHAPLSGGGYGAEG